MPRKTNQHRYVNNDNWDKVNPLNKQLFEEFIQYCEAEDKSKETVRVYKSNIKIFLVWLLKFARNKRFVDIKKKDIMLYQNWLLNTQRLSPARIKHLRAPLSSMSSFVEDILDDEYPEFRNIISKIKPPTKQETREKTVFTNEQVEKLIEMLIKDKKYQQACFVACLAASGVRKSEILQFKVSFFTENSLDEEGMYHTPKIRTKGHGKLGKPLVKFIIKDIVKHAFDLWIEERKQLGIDTDDLFVVKHKDKWYPAKVSTVNGWMNKFSKIIGEDCYTHAFRHYAATWLKRNGATIDQIKDFLGHNDTSTTQIYIDIDGAENMKGMLSFMHKKGKGEIKKED